MTRREAVRGSIPDRFITVGEIAEIAGVGPSAVSNWRKRHADFPLAAEKTPAGDRFRLGQVVSWLYGHGKDVGLPARSAAREFEQRLWDWYDSVRGFFFPSLLLHLPLQLLLVRQFSVVQEEGTPSVWDRVARSEGSELATAIRSALKSLGDLYPQLAEALEPPYSLEKLESTNLVDLVKLVADVDLSRADATGLMVSRLIENFGFRTRMRGGGYFTPHGIRRLILEILRPIEGRIYDPACGVGLFLAEAWRAQDDKDVRVYGQELNQDAWRIGVLNLALNGADFQVKRGDTLAHDQHHELRADRIALDPPFGSKPMDLVWLEKDPRWKYGLPGTSVELAWAQHLVWHLRDEGGIGVQVCTPRVLFGGGHEANLRSQLLEANRVDAVVQLPEGVLPGTGLAPALIVFDTRRADREGRVLFVDARELGQPERGGLHQLGSEDIAKITSTMRAWRVGEFKAESAFSACATLTRIRQNGWRLTPHTYVDYLSTPETIDDEPIVDRCLRFADALAAELRGTRQELASLGAELHSIDRLEDRSDWPIRDLGDLLLSKPVTGVRAKTGREAPMVPFVETGLVSGGTVSLASAPRVMTVRPSKERLTQQGDLLLVVRGIDRDKPASCLRVVFKEPAAFAGSLACLRANPDLMIPDYLRLFLTSRQGLASLRAVATGTVITNLSQAALVRVQVPVPPLERQREVVQAIRGLEAAMMRVEQLGQSIREHHDAVREGLVGGLLTLR